MLLRFAEPSGVGPTIAFAGSALAEQFYVAFDPARHKRACGIYEEHGCFQNRHGKLSPARAFGMSVGSEADISAALGFVDVYDLANFQPVGHDGRSAC